MKKVLLTAFAVMASLSLFAQGTINFANDGTSTIKRQNADNSVVAAPVTIYSVGLWTGAANSTDDSTFTFLTGSTTALGPVAGRFNGGSKTVTGIGPGATVAVEVRGWDNTMASYDAAVAGGKYAGKSGIFNVATGNPNAIPPGTPGNLVASGFTGLTLQVPEPSTIALGLLGLASLFVLRRRS